MAFFECDRYGGAVGLFCHSPPVAPKEDAPAVKAHSLKLEITADLAELRTKASKLVSQVERTSVLEKGKLSSRHQELYECTLAQSKALIRLHALIV